MICCKCVKKEMHTHTYLPLKELKGGPLLYRIVYIQAVVASKYQADRSDEVRHSVIHDFPVYA